MSNCSPLHINIPDISSISAELLYENTVLIDTTENQESNFIAAVEPCQKLSAKKVWSFYTKKPVSQESWEVEVAKAVSPIAADNPFENWVAGQEISAVEAINFRPGSFGLDVRPKVYDNISKTWTLWDTGSCVSCTPKKPEDKIDPNFRLKSVNGGHIATYGTEMITVRIGRKTYEIQAVKADIPQRILGWDLFRKYSLHKNLLAPVTQQFKHAKVRSFYDRNSRN